MEQGLAVFAHAELLRALRLHERHHAVHALLRVGAAQPEAGPAGRAHGPRFRFSVHRPAQAFFLWPGTKKLQLAEKTDSLDSLGDENKVSAFSLGAERI